MKNNILALISTGVSLSLGYSVSHAETSQLETVVVIGTQGSSSLSQLAGSVDVISQEELAYEHVDDTLELFNKVPGVYLARYNQGIINTDIAIRGFAGDGVSPHAKLLIDGIPANLHNGYNELDQLFPLGIDAITVFKGTSDPRYGLFNIAGNYNVGTRQDNAKEIELTLGSFNTREVQGYTGFNGERFSQSYAAGYRASEGYRDHTDLDKYSLGGNWAWQFDDAKQGRIIARQAGYEGDSPGYFSSTEAAQANPTGSAEFASLDGGKKTTKHLSAHWDQDFNTQIHWQLKAYTQSFERERWVRFSEAGSLTNRYDDQQQLGLNSLVSWPVQQHWQIDWGADYAKEDVIEQRFSTVSGSRERKDAIRDRAYDTTTYGSYLQVFHQPSEALRWNIALRADKLGGDFQDHLASASDDKGIRSMFDFGTIIQPKFNIVYGATDAVNIFANIGRSFQHPFGAAAYTSGDPKARDVSINDGWEAGTQWSPSRLLTFRLSYWQQKASGEFINVDGDNKNLGETDRNGIDVAFNGDISDNWSYWGNVTAIDATIVRTADALQATEGNTLRSIPDYTASLGVNYQATEKFVTRLHLITQGDYYINEANVGGKFGGYTLLNLSTDYDTGWGAIKCQLNNLTNEYYEYAFDFANDAAFTIHSPGDGINGSVSVSWNL